MKGKKPKLKIINQLSRTNARGKLKNFEIWVPLDSKDEYSRVLSMSFSNQISFKRSQQVRHTINEITSQLVESIVLRDQQDANVMINQLTIMMYNRHLLGVQADLTHEKLLLPSRISLVFDKYANSQKETDTTNVEITIEPFDMKVGFRELENFKQLQKLMTDFSARISEPPPAQDGAVVIEADAEFHKANTEQLRPEDRDLIKNIDAAGKRRVSLRDRKRKQFVIMHVKLVSESINLSLMDDTGIFEYPLINFNISKVIANFEQETGQDDAANFILKKMGISSHPSLKLEAGLLLESNYFNMDSGSYEPLIEPWTFNAHVLRKTATSAMQVDLKSDEMLNLNLTYGMALAVKQIQKKISQSTDQWENENKVEETKAKTRRLTSSRRTTKKVATEESKKKAIREGEDDEDVSGFYFENYLGVELKVTLENYTAWKEQGVRLSDEQDDSAVIVFQEWEDPGERNFRNLRELSLINKHVKKEQNNGKLVENFEDNIIRCDVYIDGFDPVTGVPIEIAGHRSYELGIKGETEKEAKKNKHQFNLVVNVASEGNRKVVSFESQCVIDNKTEFDVEIAKVFGDGADQEKTELSKQDILQLLKARALQSKQVNAERKSLRYADEEVFEVVCASQQYKVPLK